ncbi:hypothetical protein [Achromobacter xylosoxidans]|uniref:hypothetical protein n=1 Tax=Alcaligenes xylosoxydans xylosoxydans TaxID=85698 RepID=UPI0009706197|nr:hypothetical protein [Achromobacter xylosoxidans]MCH4576805.1 DUF3102 domain-containing protein [Achromobacter xylosoxidans]NYS12139.1 DUF3102 domain-containing protein [Achromobacter xylosoxidans]OMG79747.1 hypothetical protein BIZ53_12575 [Achromobacter xylosoxidans]PNL98041.1 DUF3102 domain-containing protein [Achromobacter xylosoxidans]UXL05282.1 DUF3102 domain-containing protein [Achromobacter xylosoxidans]
MARPKNSPVVAPDTAKPAADVEAALVQAAERSALVLKQFGDGLPFDLPRYEHVIRTHLARSADEMLAAGRALLVVREHVPHGEWKEFLARLSIDHTLAKRMQQAALKFSNGATSHHLIEAAGNKSKLIELLVLDDDQVAELNDGGTVAGITLDDVATMSVSDLRKTLREARAEAEANDKLLAEKNDQIDTLKKERDAANRRIKAEKPDAQLVGLHTEVEAELVGLEATIAGKLREGLEKLCAAYVENGKGDAQRTRLLAASLRAVQQQIGDLFTEFNLPQADGDELPAWAQDE